MSEEQGLTPYETREILYTANWHRKPQSGFIPSGIFLLKNMREAYRNV